MSDQLFDSEILNVILRFSNPNAKELGDTNKLLANMSMSLDSVIRKGLAAGKSIDQVRAEFDQLAGTLRELEKLNDRVSGKILRGAHQMLSRYTPERLSLMAEHKAARVAETSGTAALRAGLTNITGFLARAAATQAGVFNRVTGAAPKGRAIFLDVETTGLNKFKHQIVEISARLVEFDKKTGEITKTLEKYHGLQDLEHQIGQRRYKVSKEQLQVDTARLRASAREHPLIPAGLTRKELQGQAIAWTRVEHLLRKADFVVAHNAPFDRGFVERKLPSASTTPWFDSMRGIPWRMLGFSSRAQQDLIRQHGISPGAAHRAEGDTLSLMRLMGSRPMLGGPTYLSTLIGSQGPVSREQQILATVASMAGEMRGGLQQRLGDSGRVSWPRAVGIQRTVYENARLSEYDDSVMSSKKMVGYPRREQFHRFADGLAEVFSQYVIDEIEGGITARARRPAHSTDFGIKKGSGQSPETTPGLLGEAAIHIDRRLGTIDEFMRNLAIMSGVEESKKFLEAYTKQQEFQAGVSREIGRGATTRGVTKERVRFGDDIALAAMAGVNTSLLFQREGVPSSRMETMMDRINESRQNGPMAIMETMLKQPWAQPQRLFESPEVDSFIRHFRNNPSVSAIRTAAQMASQIGQEDPRFSSLAGILLQGQQVGRHVARARVLQARQEAFDSWASNESTPRRSSGIRDVVGETLRGLGGSALNLLRDERGSLNIDAIRGGFSRFRQGVGSIFSGFSRPVESGPNRDDIRAQIRFEAFQSKLRRLEESIETTARAFERYRDTVVPIRRGEIEMRRRARELALDSQLSGLSMSSNDRADAMAARQSGATAVARRRVSKIQENFENTSRRLAALALDADMRREDALLRRDRIIKDLIKKDPKLERQREFLEDKFGGPVRRAEMRAIQARLASETASMTDPDAIAQARLLAAKKMAGARFGVSAEMSDKRQEFISRLIPGVLGGKTPAQVASQLSSEVAQDFELKNAEIERQKKAIDDRRAHREKQISDNKVLNNARAAVAIHRVDQDLDKKSEDLAQKRIVRDRKVAEVRQKFAMTEAAMAGGVGGRGTGGGRAVGGMSEFASRGGMGFGFGLASLVAYNHAFKELIKDTVIYAARTETLQLVTDQMAKVNGLNAQSVMDVVSATKDLNITTQEAHTTVQKMMFAQLDVAKATQLARTAQDAAILSNVNSSEALDKIILGIVTGQTRVLHNMNLQVSMLQVLRELRLEKRSRGESGEPTEVEKRQAMLNKVLMEGAKIMGTYERSMLTAGKQYNSLQREIQEAQNAIGSEFLPEFGRFVQLATNGLRWMQAHGDEMARLASGMIAVGNAASALGTIAFVRWMMGAAPLGIPGKLAVGAIGLATAIGTDRFLNQDNAKALVSTHESVIDSIAKRREDVLSERNKLISSRDDSPDWQSAMARNDAALKSLSQQEVGAAQFTTQKLAEEYNKRLQNLEEYTQALEGKRGFWAAGWAALTGSSRDRVGSTLSRVRAADPSIDTGPISIDAVKLAAKLQRENDERAKKFGSGLINTELMESQAMAMRFLQAQAEMMKIEERNLETGTLGIRARKFMGSPREKVLIDYDQQAQQLEKLNKEIADLQQKAEAGDARPLHNLAKRIGGDDILDGLSKISKFQESFEAAIENVQQNRDDQLEKINRQTQAQIEQSREQVRIAEVRSQVVEGNYASEAAAIERIYQIQRDVAGATLRLLNNVDEHRKRLADADAQRQIALIQLDTQRAQASRQRDMEAMISEAEVRSERVMLMGGGSEQAIHDAFRIRFDAAETIKNENDRLSKQLQLILSLEGALRNYFNEKKRFEAEGRIAAFEIETDLGSEIDKIVSGRGRTSNQRALDEIVRTRQRDEAIALKRFDELSVLPGANKKQLENERDLSMLRANADATKATVKELDAQVEAARGRLADVYEKRFQKIERINELMATNVAEESAAAFNTHRLRLEYIEMEYEARGKTIEAERRKSEQIQEAEFDHLQRLLELRRNEIQAVRNAAGNIFDALTTRGGQGLQDLLNTQFKVTGRQITQNFAAEYFKSTREIFGGMIPGQMTTDQNGNKRPTALGRLLAGTMFSPSNTEDINKLLANVTKENTQAEQDLTQAVQSLDAALRASTGQSAPTTVGGANPLSSIPGLRGGSNIAQSLFGAGGILNGGGKGGIFSGSTASNPFVFHAANNAMYDWAPETSWRMNSQGGWNYSNNGVPYHRSPMDSVLSPNSMHNPYNKPSRADQFFGSIGGGALGGFNMWDVLRGSSSVRTGPGQATTMTGAQRAGAMLGAGATVGFGVTQAVGGFREGGARGTIGGISGLLTAASVIPGPQQPFVMAGALIAGFVKSLFGDPKANRQKEIDEWMRDHKYLEPVTINREMTTRGGLVSYDKYGMPRDTGTPALPIPIQQNLYRPSLDDSGEFQYIPGRVLDTPSQIPNSVAYYISIPVNALDAKSVMDRSADIAKAVHKELKLGSDITLGIQQAVFGAG